jgi:sugar fermentation stimulation protein A
VSETQLFQIVRRQLKGVEAFRHAPPSWLQPQHLDMVEVGHHSFQRSRYRFERARERKGCMGLGGTLIMLSVFRFPVPLVHGTFVARPQRFLVAVRTTKGAHITAYCANPGSFRNCCTPGAPILLWRSGDKARKRRYTWRAIKINGTWVGTDTHLTNRLVEKCLRRELLVPFRDWRLVQNEPRIESGRRLDFLLKARNRLCFVEAKSATVAQDDCAQFPDSRTDRTIAHLTDLVAQARAGHRAVLLLVSQRGDVRQININLDSDRRMAFGLHEALSSGVEMIGVKYPVTVHGFGAPQIIPVSYPQLS